MLKKSLFALLVALVVWSCNNQESADNQENAGCDTEEALTVDEALPKLAELVGKSVTLTGTVDHVCKHGGKRMFLFSSSPDQRIKITTGDEEASFDVAWEQTDVVVTGVLEELRVDEEYLLNWESELAAQETEETEETEHVKGEGEGSGDGHDHSAHAGGLGEQADMGKHTAAEKQIADYRAEIAESEKGYLSFYSIKANKTKLVEKKEASDKKEGEVAEETTEEGGC